MHALLRHLRRAALLSAADGPSDAQLLESFLSRRDEAAFEALVRRHGPMVLGVCRRVAGNVHDADDAFQATFLVLVRKAASLRSRHLLPGWLYGVAYRTALKTRVMANKRRAKEKQAADRARPESAAAGPPEELLARLDEELSRLPDRYRLPVLLCELQGHSRKEAAQLLSVPEGTLSWRLAQARKLLAQRLAPYGMMLSAGAVAAVLSESAVSAVPPALARAVTLQALAVGIVPAPVETLTEGVLKAMLLSKLKLVWGVALAAIVGAGAVGLMYRPAAAADPTRPGSGHATARAAEDEIDELRLEIAALRKGLQATRERVKTLEDQVTRLQQRRGATGIMGGGGAMMGSGMGPMGGVMRGEMGGGMMRGGMGMRGGGLGGGFGGMSPGGMGGMGMMHGKGGGAGMGGARGAGSAGRPGMGPIGGKGLGVGIGSAPSKPRVGKGDHNPGAKRTGNAASDNERLLERIRQLELQRDELQLQRLDDLASRPVTRKYLDPVADPLVRAQAALKRIRQHPDDKAAADALEAALKELQTRRKK